MRINITHKTNYQFGTAPYYALQQARLQPLSGPGQTVETWDLTLEGARVETEYVDHFGNHVHLLRLDSGAKNVTVQAAGDVVTNDLSGVLGRHTDTAPLWLFQKSTPLTQIGKNTRALAKASAKLIEEDPLTAMHDLSALILEKVPYEIGATEATTSAEEAAGIGAGVCQDHTHIFLTVARHHGIPARYVSGYLKMNDRVDQSATHAWAEAHIEGLGWVGFDVSNGYSPDDRYVRTAVGLDYKDCAPLTGVTYGHEDQKLVVSLQVQQ